MKYAAFCIISAGSESFVYGIQVENGTMDSKLSHILNFANSQYIDTKEPIGSKLLFLSPIRSKKGAYQLKTSLAIDSDIKR